MSQSFFIDISKWVSQTKIDINVILRKIALDIWTDIVIMSPVKTGHFRSNWHISDSLDTQVVDALISASQKLAEGTEILADFRPEVGVIYIINNVEYAIPLEYGHSQQAPQGMVRITLAKVAQEYGS